jgi:hypothetical protein
VLLNGVGITGTTTGILFNSGASLTVSDSVIQNFTGNGISFLPTSSSGISVSRTVVGKNGGTAGILVQPQGSASATADLEQVQTQFNGANAYGINIDASATTGAIVATAQDSISSNNGGGFIAQASTSGTVLMLVRCTASNNHTGVQSGNIVKPNGFVYLSQVEIVGNVNGWLNFGNGEVLSYGDNTINANSSNEFAPSSVPKK